MRWRDFDSLLPLPDNFLDSTKTVHFIGIGGIGMSALARVMAARGHRVSGSDEKAGETTRLLESENIRVVIGHSADNLQVLDAPADAVIFSSAITKDNEEFAAAQSQNIPLWHRAQLLAHFVNNAENAIAVSGTHGKSTTSACIAHILVECGFHPTAILGAVYPPFDSNVRIGSHDLLVVEADESDGSFTLLKPSVSVITNVEAEHLENYSDSEDELWRAFAIFKDSARDAVVLNADDKQLMQRLDPRGEELSFGLNNGLLRANNIQIVEERATFDIEYSMHDVTELVGTYGVGAPGRHNISNALAAVCAATTLDGQFPEAYQRAGESLLDFYGVARRFQYVGEASGVRVYDDYGHHPTEVARTLETAREFLARPILAVFQPHRYSRTQQMGRDFGTSFRDASRVIITPIYSAWEIPIEGVSSQIIYDAVRAQFPDKDVRLATSLEHARELVRELAHESDAVFCLGAGDITTLPPLILDDLRAKESEAKTAETLV